MIDNPDRVQVLYLPFPHDDLQTEGLVVSPREIDLKPKVGIVLPYGMYGTTAKVLRTDVNGNLGVSVQGAAGALPATFQDTLGHTLGPLISEGGNSYAAPFTMTGAQLINLVPPRTDTAQFISADLAAPAAYEIVFFLQITAISGTSPVFQIRAQAKDSQNSYGNLVSTAGISVAGTTIFSVGPNSTGPALSPTYRLLTSLTGTGPSVSWYLDMIYR